MGEEGFGRDSQELRVDYINGELPITHPNEEANQAARHMTLEVRGEVLPGDINSGVFSMQTYLKLEVHTNTEVNNDRKVQAVLPKI